jgi:hypothetical protein
LHSSPYQDSTAPVIHVNRIIHNCGLITMKLENCKEELLVGFTSPHFASKAKDILPIEKIIL